jgi:hypothetical protein
MMSAPSPQRQPANGKQQSSSSSLLCLLAFNSAMKAHAPLDTCIIAKKNYRFRYNFCIALDNAFPADAAA